MADVDLSNKTIAQIRGPAGNVEDVKIDDSDRFSQDGVVYKVKEPVKDERGRRHLVYDKGDPIPKIHGGTTKSNEVSELTGEVYVSSVIKQLAKSETGTEFNIVDKLKKIPIWVPVFILAILVLLSQGALGGLLPF